MNYEQFAIWLHGFLEISNAEEINKEQTQIIKDHLALLFEKKTPIRKEKKEDDSLEHFKKLAEESDIANIELQKLPIRIGCSAVGGCCCTGNCRRIVGEISREKYEQTINAVKTMSKEEFDKEIERIYFEYRKE